LLRDSSSAKDAYADDRTDHGAPAPLRLRPGGRRCRSLHRRGLPRASRQRAGGGLEPRAPGRPRRGGNVLCRRLQRPGGRRVEPRGRQSLQEACEVLQRKHDVRLLHVFPGPLDDGGPPREPGDRVLTHGAVDALAERVGQALPRLRLEGPAPDVNVAGVEAAGLDDAARVGEALLTEEVDDVGLEARTLRLIRVAHAAPFGAMTSSASGRKPLQRAERAAVSTRTPGRVARLAKTRPFTAATWTTGAAE